MNGKATCAILKQIRRDIAEKNDIALTIAECRYQGDCAGTCPRCEAEVRYLEKALAEKKRKGIQTAVAGISAGLLAAGLVSCTPVGAEKTQNSGNAANGAQIEETVENVSVEATVTDGELVPPEFTEPDGIVPYTEDNRYGEEEFPLEGEPPVTDYCADEEEEFMTTAGILPAADCEPAPEYGEEQP